MPGSSPRQTTSNPQWGSNDSCLLRFYTTCCHHPRWNPVASYSGARQDISAFLPLTSTGWTVGGVRRAVQLWYRLARGSVLDLTRFQRANLVVQFLYFVRGTKHTYQHVWIVVTVLHSVCTHNTKHETWRHDQLADTLYYVRQRVSATRTRQVTMHTTLAAAI